MTETRPETMRRILLALASSEDPAALETAAALAEMLRAEIEGRFLQDPDLMRIAALPFASEVALNSATARPLAAQRLERELRAQAAEAERLLRNRAGRRVKWSFTIVQDRRPATVFEEEPEVDLFVMGRPPSRLGSRHMAGTGPVLVLYDSGDTAARALQPASILAANSRRDLLVLLPAADAEAAARLRSECEQTLAASEARVHYLHLPPDAAPALDRIAQDHRAALLVVGRDQLLEDETTLPTLLERAPCPVVVVR